MVPPVVSPHTCCELRFWSVAFLFVVVKVCFFRLRSGIVIAKRSPAIPPQQRRVTQWGTFSGIDLLSLEMVSETEEQFGGGGKWFISRFSRKVRHEGSNLPELSTYRRSFVVGMWWCRTSQRWQWFLYLVGGTDPHHWTPYLPNGVLC